MSRSKLSAWMRSITLLASVGAPCLAQAADLLPPPPPMPAPIPVDVGGGWYLRGDVGVGATDYDRISTRLHSDGAVLPDEYTTEQRTIGDQFFAGAGVGYQFNDFLRVDATGEYRGGGHLGFVESFSLPNAYGYPGKGIDVNSANLRSILAMANVYFDLGTWYCVTPYIGGGVGGAFHEVSGYTDIGAGNANGGFGTAKTRDTTSFAWNLQAGVSYAVTPNFKVDVGYRFVNMGDAKVGPVECVNDAGCPSASYKVHDIVSHDVKIGLRYLLGGGVATPLPPLAPAYEPAPGPIVRKY